MEVGGGGGLAPERLEAELVSELRDATLLCEIDLDRYSDRLQKELESLLARMTLAKIVNAYPAIFACFLVRDVALHTEGAEVYANLSIKELRDGYETGPAFRKALEHLRLPLFESLRLEEGAPLGHKYVGLMQMHGGIQWQAVNKVMAALHATCCAGAANGQEVCQEWLTDPWLDHAVGRPFGRVLAHTHHGVRLLQGLVEVRRLHRSSNRLQRVGPLPEYVLDAAWRWLDDPPPMPQWGERIRPALRLAHVSGKGSEVVFPKGMTDWLLGSDSATWVYGSPAQESTALLPFKASGVWDITGKTDDEREIKVSYRSASPDGVVLVFDERGRYHHHALTLGGLRASVIAPRGSLVTGETSRQPLTKSWTGHEIIYTRLAGSATLTVKPPGGEALTIGLDSSLHAELTGELVEQLRGPCGERVMAGPPRVAFTGHVPPGDEVVIRIADEQGQRESTLDDPLILIEDGVYRLGQLFDPLSVSAATVTVERQGLEPFSERIVRIPGIGVAPLPLTDLRSSVGIELAVLDGFVTEPECLVAEGEVNELPFLVGAPDGSWVEVEVLVPRLMWDAFGDGDHVLVGSRDLRLGSERISSLTLKLRTGVPREVAVGLESPDGRVIQRTDYAWTTGDWAVTDVSLGQFVDTVNYAAAAARLDVVILSPQGRVRIGSVETRYVPDDFVIRSEITEDGCRLDLAWSDFRPTTDRVVRVWGTLGEGLIEEQPVPDGSTSLSLDVRGVDYGELLVGVIVDDGWGSGTPSVEPVHPGDCALVRLEGGSFGDLLAHLAQGERLQLSDAEVDEYARELAALYKKVEGPNPPARDFARRLRDLIGEDGQRILMVALELADLLGIDPDDPSREGAITLERRLLPFMLAAADTPIELASPDTDAALERLWSTAPLIAAPLDRFGHTDAPEADDRWLHYTGWMPPGVGGDVGRSFEHLVCGLRTALGSFARVAAEGAGSLNPGGWGHALSQERGAISDWFATCGKQNAKWLLGSQPQANLQPIWDLAAEHGAMQAVVHLIAAAVLAFDPGPKSVQALDLLMKAHATAPAMSRCAVAFGVANVRLHSQYPALRLVTPVCRESGAS